MERWFLTLKKGPGCVSSRYGLCSSCTIVVLYAMQHYIEPCYNGTLPFVLLSLENKSVYPTADTMLL